MIKTISKFENISVIDQNQMDNVYTLNELSYNDIPIGSGGFGSVYKLNSLNGKETKDFVIKIVDLQESQEHAYKTISLLHNKIKKHQLKTEIPIFHEYPELLGLPFIAFNAYDVIGEKEIVGFLMNDLSILGYEDYGADKEENLLNDVEIPDRLFYAFQLSKVISFLHQNNFIHADISENSLWINKKTKKLALIDYDSGFHYDAQSKPSTIGKITQWIGGRFRNIIGNKQSSDEVTIQQRLSEENWILANANFELITGLQPYFFLVDADDKTKKHYLKKYRWPLVDSDYKLYNQNNEAHYNYLLTFLSEIEENGLSELVKIFNKIFNEGYSKESELISTSQWTVILFDICNQSKLFLPEINQFSSNIQSIDKKNETVSFEWKTILSNKIFINNELVSLFSSKKDIVLSDGANVEIKVENDFGVALKSITVSANKITPQIDFFKASSLVRTSINPIELSWSVKDAINVKISTVNKTFNGVDTCQVEPIEKTVYQLTAYGNFDDIITSEVEIEIVRPVVDSFEWEINLEHGLDNIDLHWKTSNAVNVIIEPKIGIKASYGLDHIGISEPTEFKLIAKGIFVDATKYITASPFPVPIIESVFTETPRIALEYSFDASALKIPKNVLEGTSIDYLNTISVDTKIQFQNDLNIDTEIDYNLFRDLDNVNNVFSYPKFTTSNKLIEAYAKEQFSLGKIFNEIKEKIYKKLK